MANGLRLYNTLTRQVEDFRPINDPVKMYSCGPTVYDFAHIGNFTGFLYWDILVRTLKANGYTVKWITNMTDVGHLASDADEGQDKLEKTAERDQKTPWEIAEFFANDFLKHFKALNFTEPAKIARATDYIFEDLDLIKHLIDKDAIYATSDGLYFDTVKFPNYANFAHLDIKGLEAGARVGYNTEKRQVTDFAVWKFIKKDENHAMQWPLPSEIAQKLAIDTSGLLLNADGQIMSYPGWHLECSTIIHSELGEPIDIHCGGIDHIPVHHTNEIAQSQTAFGKKLANYWLHNNFITVDGQKMSKSKGNLITFYDLLEKGFSYMDFRMWVLQGHYQAERNFTWSNLEHARNLLNDWRSIAALRWQKTPPEVVFSRSEALDGLNANLTSSQTIKVLDEVLRLQGANQAFLQFIDEITGLDLLSSTPDLPSEAKVMIQTRLEARQNGDWATSDRLRDEIQTKYNVTLTDLAEETLWGY